MTGRARYDLELKRLAVLAVIALVALLLTACSVVVPIIGTPVTVERPCVEQAVEAPEIGCSHVVIP